MVKCDTKLDAEVAGEKTSFDGTGADVYITPGVRQGGGAEAATAIYSSTKTDTYYTKPGSTF